MLHFRSNGLMTSNKSLMNWLVAIKKGIQRISFYLCAIGMFLLIPMMLLTTVDVIGRFLGMRPITGTVELSQYMLLVFLISGLAYTQQVKGHVRVNFFISRLALRTQALLNLMRTLLSLFISLILVWQGLSVGLENRTVSDMLRIPQTPFRLLIPVVAFLLCLELLIDLTDFIKKLIKG